MSHVRKQIRDFFVTALTGLSTTGSNVFATRIFPLHTTGSQLPGLCIYTEFEEIDDEEGKQEHIQYRRLSVVVEGYDILATGLDDNLDTIGVEVEAAIFADQFLGGLALGTDLLSVEFEFSADAEQPVGVVKMMFNVLYFTDEGSPEIAL